MALFKPGIEEKLAASQNIVIELGCGQSRRIKGAVTVDSVDLESVDVVADLNSGIPLPDSSVDAIYSYHFLEHLENLDAFMKEVHRVLKPGGKKIGTVPHFSNPYFYSDPTHHNFFGLYTFSYYDAKQSRFRRKVPTFYSNTGFLTRSMKLNFTSPFYGRYPVKKLFSFLFNCCPYMQEFYEENLCYLMPAYEIAFELEKC